MQKKRDADRLLRVILILNGIGDFILAVLMLFVPGLLARSLGLRLTDDLVYVAGGWGVATVCLGTMRLCAGMVPRAEVRLFVAAFGLFEGVLLTAFGLAVPRLTALKFQNVRLSTLFAFIFAVAYGVAFLRRRTSALKSGPEVRN